MVLAGTETSGGSGDGTLLAFPIDRGTSGAPCEPAWQAHVGVELSVGWFVGQSDTIYAVSREQGKMLAFDAACSGKCQPIWRTPVLSGSTSDVVASTRTGPFRPAFANGLVIVATSGGKLWAFDPAACPGPGEICKPQWTWQTSGALTDPVIADGKLFVGSDRGTLYAFAI